MAVADPVFDRWFVARAFASRRAANAMPIVAVVQ